MKYKILGKRGDIPFEISADEIVHCIKEHLYSDEIQFMEHLLDESGNPCGLRCFADLGHGYGFNNGWKEFTIKIGETYSFDHKYTSIDGPSDWSNDSFRVTLKLVESE